MRNFFNFSTFFNLYSKEISDLFPVAGSFIALQSHAKIYFKSFCAYPFVFNTDVKSVTHSVQMYMPKTFCHLSIFSVSTATPNLLKSLKIPRRSLGAPAASGRPYFSQKKNRGKNALHLAAEDGALHICRFLLRHEKLGFERDARDHSGNTAYMLLKEMMLKNRWERNALYLDFLHELDPNNAVILENDFGDGGGTTAGEAKIVLNGKSTRISSSAGGVDLGPLQREAPDSTAVRHGSTSHLPSWFTGGSTTSSPPIGGLGLDVEAGRLEVDMGGPPVDTVDRQHDEEESRSRA